MLSNEEVQDIIGFGDPTQQELHLVQLGYDAARKQDTELIRQMLDAFKADRLDIDDWPEASRAAITAALARLENI